MTKKKVIEAPEPTYAASWHCFKCGLDRPCGPFTKVEAMSLRSDDAVGQEEWCPRCKKAPMWLVVDYPPEPTRRTA